MSRSSITTDPNITIPIVMRLSVLKRLTTIAEEQGVSRSALIREAVFRMTPGPSADHREGALPQ